MSAAAKKPRILVTGFSSFPGVPANPTEALIAALALRGDELSAVGEVRLDVLPVEYRAVPARLEALGSEFEPDVALHFGVSRQARGFAIETLARNTVCVARADNSGFVPADAFVHAGGEVLASSLPVEAILAVLAADGLPASASEDAGDYLCNFLFYLSRGAHCPPFAPAMAGFIHVSPFGAETADGRTFEAEMLADGALAIVGACSRAWRSGQETKRLA